MIQNDKVIKRERKSVCFYELSLINCSLHNIGHRNRLLHIVIHKHYEEYCQRMFTFLDNK